jgi:hypothetical protein
MFKGHKNVNSSGGGKGGEREGERDRRGQTSSYFHGFVVHIDHAIASSYNLVPSVCIHLFEFYDPPQTRDTTEEAKGLKSSTFRKERKEVYDSLVTS